MAPLCNTVTSTILGLLFGLTIPYCQTAEGFSIASNAAVISQVNTRLYVGMSYSDDDAEIYAYCAAYGVGADECSVEESQTLLQENIDSSSMMVMPPSIMRTDTTGVELRRTNDKSSLVASVLMADWSLLIPMLLASTFATLTASQDDVVMRVGWFFQDWNAILSSKQQAFIPILVYAAASYMSLSDIISTIPFLSFQDE